jgi:hypothetical protein
MVKREAPTTGAESTQPFDGGWISDGMADGSARLGTIAIEQFTNVAPGHGPRRHPLGDGQRRGMADRVALHNSSPGRGVGKRKIFARGSDSRPLAFSSDTAHT